ncbi:hypothetical protein [Photobacterium sp. OFAV2-7]|uniref:hypothetical protein n=1 Tax=Photobacterium sp. OFAV2-7 TaxID=2917748 RepID=UPI001EF53F14|nr:hypothetical protein [Photobacterium sp. OFAV2-7]MCG7587836.1 hypothetical protein [Photobacterium sp. OFAV2-7]
MQKKGWFCFSIVMLNPLQSVLAVEAETLFRMPSLKLGIAKSAGTIDVSSKGQFDDVAFSSSTSFTPVVTLIQSPFYFSDDSRWGYHTELNAAYFKLDYDDDNGQGFSDGEFEGYSVSFTPVLFYQWGDKTLCRECKSWRFELGAGINYLNADGALIVISGDKTVFENSGFGVNAHLGAVMNYKQWELGLRFAVPTKVDDNDVEVRHALSILSFGYRF